MAEFRNMGMLPYFDHAHWPNFRTDFQVGNRGTSDLSPYINYSCIGELDVGFLITQIGPLQPKLWSISRDYHIGMFICCVRISVLISWIVLVIY